MARSTSSNNASVRSEVNEAKTTARLPSFYSFSTASSGKGNPYGGAGKSPFETTLDSAIKETDEGIRKLFKEKLSQKIEETSKKVKEYDELRKKLLILSREDYKSVRKEMRYEKADKNYWANDKKLKEFQQAMKRFEESKP